MLKKTPLFAVKRIDKSQLLRSNPGSKTNSLRRSRTQSDIGVDRTSKQEKQFETLINKLRAVLPKQNVEEQDNEEDVEEEKPKLAPKRRAENNGGGSGCSSDIVGENLFSLM